MDADVTELASGELGAVAGASGRIFLTGEPKNVERLPAGGLVPRGVTWGDGTVPVGVEGGKL